MPRKVRSKKISRSKPIYSRKRVSNQKRRSKLRKNTRKKSRAHTPVQRRRTNTYRRDSQKGGSDPEEVQRFEDALRRGGPEQALLLLALSFMAGGLYGTFGLALEAAKRKFHQIKFDRNAAAVAAAAAAAEEARAADAAAAAAASGLRRHDRLNAQAAAWRMLGAKEDEMEHLKAKEEEEESDVFYDTEEGPPSPPDPEAYDPQEVEQHDHRIGPF